MLGRSKGKNQRVTRNATAYRQQHGRYTVSTISITEIVKGLHKSGRQDRIQILLSNIVAEEIVPFDLEAAVIAGRIYGELEKTGQTIGRADPFVAGTAIARDLVLVTGNTRHFERIVALGFPLKLLDWRTA